MKTPEATDPFDTLASYVIAELRGNPRMAAAWNNIHAVSQRQLHRRIAGILRRARRRGIPVAGEVGE